MKKEARGQPGAGGARPAARPRRVPQRLRGALIEQGPRRPSLFTVECPTGSGHYPTLHQVAAELLPRLIRLFVPDAVGQRSLNSPYPLLQQNPHWRDYVLFHEFFHGDSGVGLGANHQTGWTGLVATLIQQQAEHRRDDAAGVSDIEHLHSIPRREQMERH